MLEHGRGISGATTSAKAGEAAPIGRQGRRQSATCSSLPGAELARGLAPRKMWHEGKRRRDGREPRAKLEGPNAPGARRNGAPVIAGLSPGHGVEHGRSWRGDRRGQVGRQADGHDQDLEHGTSAATVAGATDPQSCTLRGRCNRAGCALELAEGRQVAAVEHLADAETVSNQDQSDHLETLIAFARYPFGGRGRGEPKPGVG